MIRLAISKGRILEQAVKILEKVNIQLQVDPLNSRKLIIPTNFDNLEEIIIMSSDVLLYIDSGKL